MYNKAIILDYQRSLTYEQPMSSDYPAALSMLVPDKYVFLGSEGRTRRFLILHKTAGFHTAQEVAAYFQAGAPQPDGSLAETSVHYVVGQDGVVVQCVREADGAGGNGVLEAGADLWWSRTLNPNLITFSMEHVDPAPDNSTPLTPAQQAASFALILSICTRHSIPMREADADGGITGHYSIDPGTRQNCPGNYPWDELWPYLKGAPMSQEVADFQEADQFQPGKSQFECGYFAVAMAKSMAERGTAPTLTMQQVINDAESWYAQYDGTDAITNLDGMTLPQEYSLLQQVGLHYQALPLDLAVIRGWLGDKYPVLVAITEISVDDLDLGGSPYPWGAAGTHVILLTGLDGSNVLARDSANCTNLYDAGSLRPGPRRYNASQLQFVSATVVVPPWLPRPSSATPPSQGGTMIPQGWKDTGTVLTAPNGHTLKAGFRQHVIDASSWDATDMPLEEEQSVAEVELHTTRGAGTRQLTVDRLLVYTPSMGVKESACGQELAVCYATLATQQKQIAQIAAELKAAQTPSVVAKIDTAAVAAAISALSRDANDLISALGVQ